MMKNENMSQTLNDDQIEQVSGGVTSSPSPEGCRCTVLHCDNENCFNHKIFNVVWEGIFDLDFTCPCSRCNGVGKLVVEGYCP